MPRCFFRELDVYAAGRSDRPCSADGTTLAAVGAHDSIAFNFRGPMATEDPTTPVGAYDHGSEAGWLESVRSQRYSSRSVPISLRR